MLKKTFWSGFCLTVLLGFMPLDTALAQTESTEEEFALEKLLDLSIEELAVVDASSDRGHDLYSYETVVGEPVTTSATGKPQRVSEAPVTMEILTQEDIRRSGANNIAEVLRQVNGVNVVQSSEQQYDVSIRGYNQTFSQRLLVLVNGRQVYLDHFGYVSWPNIPVQLEEIRQIEVVKGPNTALFGFNAVSGVINIVTYNPLYDDQSSAGVMVGTGGYRKAHYVQSIKPTEKVGVRFSAGAVRSDDFDNPAGLTPIVLNGESIFEDPYQNTANLDTILKATDKSQLRLELSGTTAENGNVVPTGAVSKEWARTKSVKLSYDLSSRWGLVKANIYKNYMDVKTRGPTFPNLTKMHNDVVVAQLEDTFEINTSHTARIGAEYRDNSFTSPQFIASGAEVSYNIYALSGMWNWKISDTLSWTNAVRADHLVLDRSGPFQSAGVYTNDDFDQKITEYSYNSGFVWKPTAQDTLRLNTGRGLEVPSLFEYGADVPVGGPAFTLGNPRLETTVVTNYELAWDRRIEPLNGLFRSAVFYQMTKDVQALGGASMGPVILADNIGDSYMYGIELGLEGEIGPSFDWGVSYIYQNIDDDLNNGKSGTSLSVVKEFEDGNPEHQLNLKLGYTNGPWEADTHFYYTSQTDQAAFVGGTYVLDNIDGYIGANARVAYTFEGSDVTLSLQGQQLLRSRTKTSVAPDIDRRVFLSLSKQF